MMMEIDVILHGHHIDTQYPTSFNTHISIFKAGENSTAILEGVRYGDNQPLRSAHSMRHGPLELAP